MFDWFLKGAFVVLCLALPGSLVVNASAQETVLRGPYLQRLSHESVIVRWRTDVPVGSAVRYGTSANLLNQLHQSTVPTTEHSIVVVGLSANTRYYYAIGTPASVPNIGDSDHTFRTAPTPGTPVPTRFWVLGDSGTADANAAAVRDRYLDYTNSNTRADFLLMLGDNAYQNGTDSEYQSAVFDMYPEVLLRTPLWSTLGNHDGASASSTTQTGPYYDIHTLPKFGEAGGIASGTEAYYSFTYGNIHFVCLNSHDVVRSTSGAMLQWLEADLAANDSEWLIAFWHHPPYSKGSHDSDTEARLVEMRQNALPLLERYGVDLVLSGHSHSYERSFLIDGHYGNSSTFSASMKKDSGNGDPLTDGAYDRLSGRVGANQGAVYAVPGSSGKITAGPLNHPAMVVSLLTLGSMLIDVDGNQLQAIFLDDTGAIRDSFKIVHGTDSARPQIESVTALSANSIEVVFSEAMLETSVEQIANYRITEGVSVLGATLQPDNRSVLLTVSPLQIAVVYGLSVPAAADLSSNPAGVVNGSAVFTFVPTSTLAFQNGVSPSASYAGTVDTMLAQATATTNFGSDTRIAADGDDPGGTGQDVIAIMQWDIQTIPSDAVVTRASLSLRVANPTTQSYSFNRLLRGWSELEATWNSAASGQAWQSAGASGASDRDNTQLATVGPVATGKITIELPTAGIAAVQDWITNPTSNFGLVLWSNTSSDGVDFASSEDLTVLNRPQLLVSYQQGIGAGDSVAPSSPANFRSTAQGSRSISLAWDAATDDQIVVGYVLFRDGELVTTTSGLSFTDTGLSTIATYRYTLSAVDAAGNVSPVAGPLDVATQFIDSDHDGYADDQEAVDGTNPNDRGSYLERLGTKVCTEWNGFLEMHNFLELVNTSSNVLPVTLALYNRSGAQLSSAQTTLAVGGQWDQPVHAMPGFAANAYGIICAQHSGAPGALDGRMVFYRPELNQPGRFQFALAMPFSNGKQRSQFVPYNTFNPSLALAESANAVANWIQITNLSESSASGRLFFYNQVGVLLNLGGNPVVLGPGERVDYGAHEFGTSLVGLAEWRPDTTSARFIVRSVRYLYDNPSFTASFAAAAQVEGQIGTGETLLLPADTRYGSSIVELTNTSAIETSVALRVARADGSVPTGGALNVSLGARATRHIILDGILGAGEQGQVSVAANTPESLTAVSMHYERTPSLGVSLMYAIEGLQALGTAATGSYNTFLNQGSELLLLSNQSTLATATLSLISSSGTIVVAGEQLAVPARGAATTLLDQFVSSDSYGRARLSYPSQSLLGWVLRRKELDYVLPTRMRP